jgi:hypothetical protein
MNCEMLKGCAMHGLDNRDHVGELGQVTPNMEGRPKIWQVYYRKQFKNSGKVELEKERDDLFGGELVAKGKQPNRDTGHAPQIG